MPMFVIEREMPGIGDKTDGEFRRIAQASCGVIRDLGPGIQWVESFVGPEKIYCIYIADNEEILQQHADACGIPASCITKIGRVINPTTAEQPLAPA